MIRPLDVSTQSLGKLVLVRLAGIEPTTLGFGVLGNHCAAPQFSQYLVLQINHVHSRFCISFNDLTLPGSVTK